MNYTNYSTPVNIICSVHGIFQITPACFLDGYGCNRCNPRGYSKVAMQWLNYIAVSVPNLQHALNGKEYTIKDSLLRADGYDKETNTIYEFNGTIWHGDPRRCKPDDINPMSGKPFSYHYNRTIMKREYIKEKGYNLIELWEYDWRRAINAIRKIQKYGDKNTVL